MPTFIVPIIIEINGSIEVESEDREAAIQAAKDEYDRRAATQKSSTTFGMLASKVIDGPDVQVIFASGDDPNDVESEDDDEDEQYVEEHNRDDEDDMDLE